MNNPIKLHRQTYICYVPFNRQSTANAIDYRLNRYSSNTYALGSQTSECCVSKKRIVTLLAKEANFGSMSRRWQLQKKFHFVAYRRMPFHNGCPKENDM